jgi:hypothetical protein
MNGQQKTDYLCVLVTMMAVLLLEQVLFPATLGLIMPM